MEICKMKKLVISNIAYAGVCENGHYIERDGNTTVDYGTSQKCADVALAEQDALSELTKPIPEEDFLNIHSKKKLMLKSCLTVFWSFSNYGYIQDNK